MAIPDNPEKTPVSETPRSLESAPSPVNDSARQLAGPTAKQVDKMASRIAVVPGVDFGDQDVGTKAKRTFQIWNTGKFAASSRITLTGHPAFELVSAPSRIRAASDGNDMSEVVLAFRPTAKGKFWGDVGIALGWEGNDGYEATSIHVWGAAHEWDQPTIAEEEEATARRQREDKKQQDDQVATERSRKRIEQDEAHGKARHPGHVRALEREKNQFQAAMLDLLMIRQTGIAAADTEIGAFKRAAPAPEDPSLLETLAWMAFEVATAGIAGAIGKRVEKVAAKWLGGVKIIQPDRFEKLEGVPGKHETIDASKELVAFFQDSAKGAVKDGGKLVKGRFKHDHSKQAKPHAGEADWKVSPDPKAEFLAAERAHLLDASGNNQHSVMTADGAFDRLLPVLDRDHAAAVGAMRQLTAEVNQEATPAATTYTRETVLHWVQYVAQTSMGSLTPDQAKQRRLRAEESPLSDARRASHAPTTHSEPAEFNGLVDIRFTVDVDRPTEKAVVKSAHIHGVRKGVAERLRKMSLLDAHVPVRAVALPTRNSAVTPLTIVRDEAGNLTYTDNIMVADGHSDPHWLGRKANEDRAQAPGGPGAQLRGARKLMNEELLGRTLEDHDLKEHQLKTDGED